MKRFVCILAIAAVGLSGCIKARDGARSGAHGRFIGVGVYQAGQMWSQMVVANASKNPAAAKLNDDEQVIVVVDSNTGELRQCGNLTGYCVGMNPWANPLGPSQLAPISVSKHADQLATEAAAATKDAKSHNTEP